MNEEPTTSVEASDAAADTTTITLDAPAPVEEPIEPATAETLKPAICSTCLPKGLPYHGKGESCDGACWARVNGHIPKPGKVQFAGQLHRGAHWRVVLTRGLKPNTPISAERYAAAVEEAYSVKISEASKR